MGSSMFSWTGPNGNICSPSTQKTTLSGVLVLMDETDSLLLQLPLLLPAMAVSLSGLCRCPPHLSSSASGIRGRNSCVLSVSARAKEVPGNSGNGRRVWRRRKLTKKDEKAQYKMERIPFLEEQIRKIRETGKIMSMDIERLLLSEENRFDFVNEVAAEATAYVQNNPDEYGGKKAIMHVLSNRVNEAGFDRPEAYIEQDPFKPGPNYLREYL